MKKSKLYSIITGILVFLFCSCLDAFFDNTEKIAGDIYFVNLEGSGQPFIGRKSGNNNYTALICCNVKEVIGNKTLLLVRQPGPYPDTTYYMIYPEKSDSPADTLSREKYYELLDNIEKSIHFIPKK